MLFTPGPHPVEECAVHLAAATGGAPGALVTELLADPAALHQRIRRAVVDRAPDIGALIAVDQFEEVFTLCRDREERDAFVALLIAATRRRPAGPGWYSASAPTSTATACRTPGWSKRCATRRSRSDR
ncbi:hypothetical protein ACFV2Q_31345 [Streptomyces sp. NPDC059650]|uniref:nSTAND1 domain-containing NTPase n=1 Tax=Streptomyces sp. NPDC059650 TaxID=3346896 RepID=UPI0036C19DEC